MSCTPDTNFETASKDQMEAFNELQRLSGSPECAARYLETVGDPRVPSDLGRELAAGITGVRFVALPGKNHVLLEQDPGLPRFFEELKDFLTDVS